MLQSENNFTPQFPASDTLYRKHKMLNLFTLIELLVVVAIIAILLRSIWLYFLLFSAYFAFSRFDEKKFNTQIQNITFCMVS